jgi:glycerol uptake facilitator-like aquaporin
MPRVTAELKCPPLIPPKIVTMFLMIAINWASCSDSVPFAAGATAFVMATIFGGISGGHFNSAVTLGMLWKEGKANFVYNLMFSIFIMLFQGAGAFAGCFIALMAFDFGKKPDVNTIPSSGNDYYIAQLCPVDGCNDEGAIISKVFCIEMICTFLFVTFVLCITHHNGASDAPINCAAIGLALFCAIKEAAGVSGGAINPTVGLVQSIFQKTVNAHVYPKAPNTEPTYIICYVGGGLLGGFLAGLFQKLIYEFALKHAEEASDQQYAEVK